MKTLETIKKAVQEHIANDQYHLELYNKLFEALKKHDGQKFSKRFQTTAQNALGPAFDVYYKLEFGMYYLKIRKTGESSSKYKDILIGYDSNPVFKLETTEENGHQVRGFDNFAAAYGSAAKERIKKNEKYLKSGKLEKYAELVDQKNAIEKQIQKLNVTSAYEFPAAYAVEHALKGEA